MYCRVGGVLVGLGRAPMAPGNDALGSAFITQGNCSTKRGTLDPTRGLFNTSL